MFFASFDFLCLLTLVVTLYFSFPKKHRWLLLLGASYFFYGYHNVGYLLLITFSTGVDYVAAIRMHESSRRSQRKFWLWTSLISNLGLLFFFKYFNFFGEELHDLLGLVGLDHALPTHSLALPIGLSFYTFQTISYTVDVYRGYLKPERHYGKFALFVCFFPQLVAGPIEKAAKLLPQLRFDNDFVPQQVVSGCRLILWGFFKKIVVADRLAAYVNEVMALDSGHGGITIAAAGYLFWLQLFYDFSAYCDIAIGLAKIFGVQLSRNFYNHIYVDSFTTFWMQWHITLTNWFRSYVFVPLVQWKKGRTFWYTSLFITFALTGLWHGANWTFILWGAVNGVFLIVEHVTKLPRHKLYNWMGLKDHPKIRYALGMGAFLLIGLFPSLLFRAEDLSHFALLMDRMLDWSCCNFDVGLGRLQQQSMLLFLVFAECLNIIMGRKTFDVFCQTIPAVIRWGLYLIFIYAILLFQGSGGAFVYFEF